MSFSRNCIGRTILKDMPSNRDEKTKKRHQTLSVTAELKSQGLVDADALGLGFFTFSKFLMWRDLHPASWPNNALLDHPLVSTLLGENTEFESYLPLVADDLSIDEHIDISKCIHIVDADSSQAIVVEEARAGRNLVVQGPPGTGKSQTITNAIASAATMAKPSFLLLKKPLHLRSSTTDYEKPGSARCVWKSIVAKRTSELSAISLEQALRCSDKVHVHGSLATELAMRRDRLNQRSNALHKEIGQSGRSAFDVIGQQVKLRAEGVRLLENRLDDAGNWSASKLLSIGVAVERAAVAIAQLNSAPKAHPWYGTNVDAQNPFDSERLVSLLNDAIAKMEALNKETKTIISAVSHNSAPCLADALALIKAFRHVAAVPKHSRRILANSAWSTDAAAVESAIERARPLAVSIGAVDARFTPEAWSCDADSILLALRGDGNSFLRRFGRRFRRTIAQLRTICLHSLPRNLSDRTALAEMLRDGQTSKQRFETEAPLLKATLGPIWAGHKTAWNDAIEIAAWARCAMSELGGSKLLMFATRAQDLRVYSNLANKLQSMVNDAQQSFDQTQRVVRASLPTVFKCANYESAPLDQLLDRMTHWRNNSTKANDWVAARTCISTFERKNWTSLLTA